MWPSPSVASWHPHRLSADMLYIICSNHTLCRCAAFPTYPRPAADDAVSLESGERTPSLSKRTASGGLDAPRRVCGEP